jgi:hypothetical protein
MSTSSLGVRSGLSSELPDEALIVEGWQDIKYRANVLDLKLGQIGEEYATLSHVLCQHGEADFSVIGQHFGVKDMVAFRRK